MTGTVADIWLASERSAPMRAVERAEAVAGRGFRGDRYFRGTGYYSGFDECAVTLLAQEAIEEIHEQTGIDLSDGRHRRNVVTRGVDVHDLLETRFRVGDALFEGTRPRPPCAHVEETAGESGVARALGDGRGGICATVVDDGQIRVGDEIEILESTAADPDALAAAIRRRYE